VPSSRRFAVPTVLAFVLAGGMALAVEPGERLADPALEARARALSKELRCLVCQNQSIDDSNAPLARDLRRAVRERLRAGDSDAAAKAWLVARYGDFVLLRPPVKPETWALWFLPAVVLVLGALLMAAVFRRGRGRAAPAPLTPAEETRLRRLVGDDPPA